MELGRRMSRFAVAAGLLVTAWVVTPAADAAALPPFTCGTVSAGSTSGSAAPITRVSVGHHPGYDRFVVEFAGSRVPHYTVTPKSSAVFYLDPSNKKVTLLGTAGIRVALFPASGRSYHGPTDIRTSFPQLREARRIGDFEAVTSWGIGLAHQSCKRVFTLSAPSRLVIDVPA